MKYNVGDKVRIKSLDWYNENKDAFGDVLCGEHYFTGSMKKLCSEIFEISNKTGDGYFMLEDKYKYVWTDEMIEGLVEEIEITQDTKTFSEGYNQGYEDGQHDISEITLPQGYQFVDENGNVINAMKIVLEKKKKEYPKTYEECLNVLGYDDRETYCIFHSGADERLFEALYRLKVCRDAYWKIAGEEMGLDKPWEPDWNNSSQFKDVIICRSNNIIKYAYAALNTILAFPTEEMRDAFKENFDPDIKICKELL